MKSLDQKGSLHLGLLVGVLVLAGVVFAGYRVWSNQHAASDTTTTTASATVPSAINSKADLTQTGKALDQTDSELDSSLNDSRLDSDINSML